MKFRFFISIWALCAATTIAQAGPIGLVLPTENDAIFSSDPSRFYMYTDRMFEGVRSKPWTGGTYGFSRNQKRTSHGIVFTRLHEGIDVKPLRRDANGEPLDQIRSIADGQVVYVNNDTKKSNYGKYLVIHHDWGEGPFFSLYSHLHSASVRTGQTVSAGDVVARMGYTGRGINKERAHLHLELCFLWSDHFQRWFDQHYRTTNHHGIFSGLNLVGLDLAALYKGHRKNPSISIRELIRSAHPTYYTVAVPNRGKKLALLQRYPWLDAGGSGSASYEMSFSAEGIPTAVRRSSRKLSYPSVISVKSSPTDHSYHTSSRITGVGSKASLTANGSRFIQLVTERF